VTLTAQGGDSLLHAGAGNDTLVGGTGTCDLLFGGTGNTTLKAGTGNDYLFGGTGNNTFVDNIGNNFMKGGPKANAYVFNEAHSGHDTIANFNAATDQLQITHNLNGNGIATVADVIAHASVSNGNTILHLGAQDDITLLGIATPSDLSHAIVIM
jgi:Ca2+-binding RTX toxin-like protein